MKVLVLSIFIFLFAACGPSQREQKLADEVLKLKEAELERKSEEKTQQLEEYNLELKRENAAHQNGRAALIERIDSLVEEIGSLKTNLSMVQKQNTELQEKLKDAGLDEEDHKKPVPIVPEGESIVINPAGSGGTRYLLIEIFLLRKDEKDISFSKAVASKSKVLQALTVDYLSAEDAQSLVNPITKERLKAQLKLAYQDKLGKGHPIKELIFSKWIMQ